MTPAVAQLVGREAELDRILAFLGRRDELPAGLLLEGQAGAGKTTLWRAGIEAAAESGYRVLACRAAGAEVQLSYAALADLLEPHLQPILASLPKPQRRALEVALLLEDDDGSAPDRRAIAAGALSAVRGLAREQPVLLAIDDAQWVDAPSAEVVEFVLRRLGTAPVAILASRRLASPTAPSPGASAGVRPERALERSPVRVEVGPLSLGALQRILRTRTSIEASRRTLQRIHETSGGNPFYALELARALEDAGAGDGRAPGVGGGASAGGSEPLSLGSDLGQLLAERLQGLQDRTREALFVAAALTEPTLAGIAAATGGTTAEAERALDPAVRASIVRVVPGAGAAGADRSVVEFAHPLLAATAYNAIEPAERRRWHARIAAISTDVESEARHLAFARPGQDAEVAARLAEAARAARDRGAPSAAAELFLEALDRLPPAAGDPAETLRRAELVVDATPSLQAAGEDERAREFVEAAMAEVPPGPVRCDLALLLTELVEDDEAGMPLQLRLIEQALSDARGDPRRTALALLDREQMERSMDRSPNALALSRQALAAAEASGDERMMAMGEVRVADLEVILGLTEEDPIARFARALELGERHPVDAENSAKSMLAVCLIRRGRLDEARPYLEAERVRSAAEGDEGSVCWTSLFQAELEWLAGEWDACAAIAGSALEVARHAGLRMREGGLQSLAGLVEASRGNPERARTMIENAIAILDDIGEVAYGNYAKQILAFHALTTGDAAGALEPVATYPPDRPEGSKRLSLIGDSIEALVQLGDVEGAANLASTLGRRGAELSRPTLSAVAARCRALVLGARGDLDGAIAAGEEAVAIHTRLGLPFERARSLLVLGEVQRRAKQRRAARETLTEAVGAFNALGAHLWVARAEAERARIGGRSTIDGLSETELRVARLVAEGKSNKEVAAELFVSVRAVEANLSKVYAKLGIESRMELARRI
jgi:DNA-binding CsgD family transcriptional regulator